MSRIDRKKGKRRREQSIDKFINHEREESKKNKNK